MFYIGCGEVRRGRAKPVPTFLVCLGSGRQSLGRATDTPSRCRTQWVLSRVSEGVTWTHGLPALEHTGPFSVPGPGPRSGDGSGTR